MPETLGDRIYNFWENYIARSNKAESTKEKSLYTPGEYSPENALQGYDKLTPRKRRLIALQSPLLMKGINKKSLDTFRAWFEIETQEGHGLPIKADLKAFRDFENRSNFKNKCFLAMVGAYIYGNGFIILSFTNDEGKSLSTEPSPKAEPFRAEVLNSEYINGTTPGGNYVFEKNDGTEKKIIHKDRVLHFKAVSLPGFRLGTSIIDVLRWTLFSKKNVDIAAGHILSWFAHGMVDLKWENMSPEQEKIAKKMLDSHPGSFYHDQDVEIDIKNPTAIDPKPFYDYIVLNLAGALNMPTHVLTGIQTGRVTGSEIGFADYYRDIRDIQGLQITPLIEKVYAKILQARGKTWKYRIEWNPIYIDEMAEAKLMKEKTQAADLALNGTKGIGGFVDEEEARTMFNKGQIQLDTAKKVEPRPQPQPEPAPKPNTPRKPTKPKVPSENKAMIQRWKELKKQEIDDLEEKVDDKASSSRS